MNYRETQTNDGNIIILRRIGCTINTRAIGACVRVCVRA